MQVIDANRERWEREYSELKVIPSTTTKTPSKILRMYGGLLDFGGYHRVFDSGCGNGRNAIYLAQKGCEVYCMDFSKQALSEARQYADNVQTRGRIRFYEGSLMERLPFGNGYFDLIVDSYTFCHFLGKDRERYCSEVARITRLDGDLFLSLFPPDDGYYGPMLKNGFEEAEVTDPSNGIKKRLYSEHEIERLFATHFEVVYSASLGFNDTVRDHSYQRRVLGLILRKLRN